VKIGDTLASIAVAHQDTQSVDYMQICFRNELADCNVVMPGQTIIIPCDLLLPSKEESDASDDDSGYAAGLAVLAVLGVCAGLGVMYYRRKSEQPVVAQVKNPQQPPPPPPPTQSQQEVSYVRRVSANV